MFKCFTDKAFLKRFIKISLPVMISGFISFIVSFVDNIMVGTISNEVVSGVYAANQVTYLITLAIFGVTEGAGIFIQQYNGANDPKHIRQCYFYKWVTMLLFLLITIPVIYIFGSDFVYLFCKSDSNAQIILKEGTNYLMLVTISFVPYAIGTIYSTSLKETGETKPAMYGGILAIFSNVILNAIFIMILKWGAQGAAIATIIARVIEMSFLILYSHLKKKEFCSHLFKDFKLDFKLYGLITKKGWLLFVNEIGFSLGMILQSMAYSQRDGVLSSISIVSTISNIFAILFTGISTGIGVMVGGDLGANEFDKAIDENKKLNFLGFYASILTGILLICLSPVIPYMFKEVTIEQKALATKLIIIYASIMPFAMLCVTAYFTLRVGGKTFQTFLLDTGTMILVYVPLSWVLAYFTNMNIIYIYLIVHLVDVLKAIFGIFLMKKHGWVRNITIQE